MRSVAVIDLGYGDSGKGILVARICATEQINHVIRFSGGCQAAHNVITEDGRHHTFAQFGSGTFSNVPTYLSKFMLVEPFALIHESYALAGKGIENPLGLVSIASEAYMTTPYHWELNRYLEEQRGDGRHGSTGRGIGVTAQYRDLEPDAPMMMDLLMIERLREKLEVLREWVLSQGVPDESLPGSGELAMRYKYIRDQLNIVSSDYLEDILQERCVFEGSQGVLLDEDYGFFPHVTRSITTDRKLHELVAIAGCETPEIIGVVRAYMTRHGHGPMVGEDSLLDLPELHNRYAHWMGGWRIGHLDLPALQYAISVCQRIDGIYVTHLDTAEAEPNVGAVVAYVDRRDGSLWTPQRLDRYDFKARTKQTERLKTSRGVIAPILHLSPAAAISAALDRPLVGWGNGPRIDQGTGIKMEEIA